MFACAGVVNIFAAATWAAQAPAQRRHADFPILSDPDKKVANAYGVIPAGRPPDRPFASRWTFYIDPKGKIAAIDKEVKPATSGEAVVAKLTELGVKKRRPKK